MAGTVVWTDGVLAQISLEQGETIIIRLAIAATISSTVAVAAASELTVFAMVALFVAFTSPVAIACTSVCAQKSAVVNPILVSAGVASFADALTEWIAYTIVVARICVVALIFASEAGPSFIAYASCTICAWIAFSIANVCSSVLKATIRTDKARTATASTSIPQSLPVAGFPLHWARSYAALVVFCTRNTWPLEPDFTIASVTTCFFCHPQQLD
jgi:hypothetical protein